MSRFANRTATRTVDLGPCECPGLPHDSDWAKVRSDLAQIEVARLVEMESMSVEGAAEVVAEFIPEWNLLADDGSAALVSPEMVLALRVPTVTALRDALVEAIEAAIVVPKASGAPSRGSSRGSASRTRSQSRKPGT